MPLPATIPHRRRERRRGPRPWDNCFLRSSPNELYAVDGFMDLAGEAWKSQKARLEKQAAQIHQHTPDDDQLVDDFAQLDDFAAFSAEFAIIGLWRCVEIYRKTAIRIASGERAAARAFRHKEFQKELSRLGISEQRIHSWPGARNSRAQKCVVAHASRPTRQDWQSTEERQNQARRSRLRRTVAPSASTPCT